jgi:hypothetical protein
MKLNIYRFSKYSITAITLLFIHSSCNKFVEVGTPTDKVVSDKVFESPTNATAAIVGIYSQLLTYFLNFGSGAITVYSGLSADELTYTGNDNSTIEFNKNALSSTNGIVYSNLWIVAYRYAYQANACIEGLQNSKTLSSSVKNQLLGESKVIRAFIYFNLVQLFGDVPLILTSDYNANSHFARTPAAEVYNQIVADLTDAKALLTPSYPTTGATRPNVYTADALLARVYLYTKKWDLALNPIHFRLKLILITYF